MRNIAWLVHSTQIWRTAWLARLRSCCAVARPRHRNPGFLDKLGDALFDSTGVRLAGAALVAYAVVSVASRLYPPRNAVPLP